MSPPDYYKVLQVSPAATTAEIKAAYRRLAKIYHPDKSGSYADEERFKQIKEAYETLVDPQRRARYNAKINRATTFSQGSGTGSNKQTRRRDSFTDAEAKRRQYYQEHFKKAGNAHKQQTTTPAPHQPNELKYILISVPVAVALLLLIIRIYEKPEVLTHETKKEIALDTLSDVRTPESPYRNQFGLAVNDSMNTSVLRIQNRSGFDAVVFILDSTAKIARHHFVGNNYEVFVQYLPYGSYTVCYWMGKHFSSKSFIFKNIIGSFRTTITIDSIPSVIRLRQARRDTLNVSLTNTGRRDSALLRKLFSVK